MMMLQRPKEVTILYDEGPDVRHVRMNQPHPAKLTPSWYGDSVGHYEGDTLVIDTVGTRTDRPFPMLDLYGTPYTKALHVVERYRLIDYEAAQEGLQRDAKENQRVPGDIDPNYRGKFLQVQFTVEDEGVFTTPWSGTITYRPAPAHGRKSPAPKTPMNIITTRSPTSPRRPDRISRQRCLPGLP